MPANPQVESKCTKRAPQNWSKTKVACVSVMFLLGFLVGLFVNKLVLYGCNQSNTSHRQNYSQPAGEQKGQGHTQTAEYGGLLRRAYVSALVSHAESKISSANHVSWARNVIQARKRDKWDEGEGSESKYRDASSEVSANSLCVQKVGHERCGLQR